MSQGVPGIPPPKFVLERLAAASSDPNACGYCPISGELEMRLALTEEMKVIYGRDIDLCADDVALTAGCNLAFVASIKSLADAGDEVILPVPWYFNHQMSLDMLEIKTVPLRTLPSEGFLPSPERCAALITPKTKAIVLVSPNNPTGATYPHSLISSFALLAKQKSVALIIDETYRDFIQNGSPHTLFTPGASQPNQMLPRDWSWRHHFIHLFSFSKSYCLPGHRLGAIIAPAEVLEQVRTVLDNIQICPPRPVQLALCPILPNLRSFISDTSNSLVRRQKHFRERLPRGWKVGSQGAYYAFVQHPFKGVSAIDVSRRLAIEVGVVTLPAPFFAPTASDPMAAASDDEWIRFSVANVDDETVEKVCQRLEECQTKFGWEVENDAALN